MARRQLDTQVSAGILDNPDSIRRLPSDPGKMRPGEHCGQQAFGLASPVGVGSCPPGHSHTDRLQSGRDGRRLACGHLDIPADKAEVVGITHALGELGDRQVARRGQLGHPLGDGLNTGHHDQGRGLSLVHRAVTAAGTWLSSKGAALLK